MRLPVLKAAVAVNDPPDAGRELATVAAEQYSTIERLRGVLSVIGACAADLPAPEAMYFGHGRRRRIDLLSDYLRRRAASGRLRTLPDLAVAAQIVTETVACSPGSSSRVVTRLASTTRRRAARSWNASAIRWLRAKGRRDQPGNGRCLGPGGSWAALLWRWP
jgi:hypothetical protein